MFSGQARLLALTVVPLVVSPMACHDPTADRSWWYASQGSVSSLGGEPSQTHDGGSFGESDVGVAGSTTAGSSGLGGTVYWDGGVAGSTTAGSSGLGGILDGNGGLAGSTTAGSLGLGGLSSGEDQGGTGMVGGDTTSSGFTGVAAAVGGAGSSWEGGAAGFGGASGGGGGSGEPPLDPCTSDRYAKAASAVYYFTNRIMYDNYVFAECLNRSYLCESNGKTGLEIAASDLSLDVALITCIDFPLAADGEVSFISQGGVLVVDNRFVDSASKVQIAGALMHWVLHGKGYTHGTDPSYYNNTVPAQAEACMTSWREHDAADKGYVVWRGGEKVLHQANWSRESAIIDCSNMVVTYPDDGIVCYFDGVRLGYERYRDCIAKSCRVAYRPALNRDAAAADCTQNLASLKSVPQECLFNGSRLGYELWGNGNRTLHQPTATKQEAIANCSGEVSAHPAARIECYFDGRGLGYERFWNGKRDVFQPAWSFEDAAAHCQTSRMTAATDIKIECLFDGDPLP